MKTRKEGRNRPNGSTWDDQTIEVQRRNWSLCELSRKQGEKKKVVGGDEYRAEKKSWVTNVKGKKNLMLGE